MRASSDWRSKTPWVLSQTVRRSPSQLATEPCVSIGVCSSQAVR